MSLTPNAQKIADQYGHRREEELWNERATRVSRFVYLRAPRIILVHSCLILLNHYGMADALWFWFKSHYWTPVKFRLWHIWMRTILGHTDAEIERTILEDD